VFRLLIPILLLALPSAWSSAQALVSGEKIAALARDHVDSLAASSGLDDRQVEATSIPADRTCGEADLRITGPRAPLAPGVHMVTLRTAGAGRGSRAVATVAVRLRAYAPACRARRSIARGEEIGPDDVELRRTELAPKLLARMPEGQRARRPIARGAALRSSDLEPIPQIRSGDRVEATLERGGLRLVLAGRALEDAAIGETFRIHDPRMRRALRARALAPGRAELEP